MFLLWRKVQEHMFYLTRNIENVSRSAARGKEGVRVLLGVVGEG